MEKQELIERLRAFPPDLDRRFGCPADDSLASFMDGGLSEEDHERLVSHFADCDYCVERIGILGRAMEADADVTVPELAAMRW